MIKRSLVDDNQLTGAEETCVLIDGTVRKTPVAEVEVNTPYYQGKVRAVCMRDPLSMKNEGQVHTHEPIRSN